MNDNPIASMSAAHLRSLWHKLGRLTIGIRVPALLPVEANRLGGALFPNAEEMVVKVAHALIGHPTLFPDGAATGKHLLDRQARADAAFDLRNRLQGLAKQLGDYHLQEQSEVVKEALTILDDIKTRAANARSTDARRRSFMELLAMGSPLKLLITYQRGVLAAKAQQKALREQAEAGEQPLALQAPKSPQKLRAEQQAKAIATREIHKAFEEHMSEWVR